MLKKLKQSNRGFTIIEVLIVLAIAGLIMLIVFLAVPALQRNQRNTSRKQDATRVGGAVTNFIANNNGTAPRTAAAGWTADGAAILTDAGTLSGFGALTVSTAAPASSTFTVATATQAALATTLRDAIRLVERAACNATGGGTTGGTTRQNALQYTLETGTANVSQPGCINL